MSPLLFKYIMNLYNLHKDPKSLDHHDEAHDAVVELFWFTDIYHDPDELKKREKNIATSAKYSFEYAKDILKGPFKLGEPAIAKDGGYSFAYAQDVLKARFKLGEEAIAKGDSYFCLMYAFLIRERFKAGEANIKKEGDYWDEYAEHFLPKN